MYNNQHQLNYVQQTQNIHEGYRRNSLSPQMYPIQSLIHPQTTRYDHQYRQQSFQQMGNNRHIISNNEERSISQERAMHKQSMERRDAKRDQMTYQVYLEPKGKENVRSQQLKRINPQMVPDEVKQRKPVREMNRQALNIPQIFPSHPYQYDQVQVLQQEVTYLKNKISIYNDESIKMREDNQAMHQELRKVEFQRNTLQTSYTQLVHIQEQLQRDHYSQQQRMQQLNIDNQYQEKCNQKLLDHIQMNIDKPDQVKLQTQVLDLEQENYCMRQELGETRELWQDTKRELDSLKLENTEIAQERALLKQEQDKLLRLSDELLIEATQLRKSEEDSQQQDPQLNLLNDWRNFVIQKYTEQYQKQQEMVQQKMETDSKASAEIAISQQSQEERSSRQYYTKIAFQKLNKLTMSSAGLLSFKLNYSMSNSRLKRIKQQIEELRI